MIVTNKKVLETNHVRKEADDVWRRTYGKWKKNMKNQWFFNGQNQRVDGKMGKDLYEITKVLGSGVSLIGDISAEKSVNLEIEVSLETDTNLAICIN